MKFKTADWIQSVIAAAKIGSITKMITLLELSDKIQESQKAITTEYSKIVEANLEVKKDDQWMPILKNGEQIKFVSQEWKKKIEELELDVKLPPTTKKLVEECISDVLENLTGEDAQEVLILKKRLVELYLSI